MTIFLARKVETREPIDQFIGMRIRERRAALGMSQRDLAKPLGVAPYMISKYEKGHISLSASRLYKITELLRASPDYFFEGFDDHSMELPAEQRLLLSFTRSIGQIDSEAHLEALAHVVRTLASKGVQGGKKVRGGLPPILTARRAAR